MDTQTHTRGALRVAAVISSAPPPGCSGTGPGTNCGADGERSGEVRNDLRWCRYKKKKSWADFFFFLLCLQIRPQAGEQSAWRRFSASFCLHLRWNIRKCSGTQREREIPSSRENTHKNTHRNTHTHICDPFRESHPAAAPAGREKRASGNQQSLCVVLTLSYR